MSRIGRLPPINPSGNPYAITLRALREGNSVKVSAKDYTLGQLRYLAEAAANGGGQLIITDVDTLRTTIFFNPALVLTEAGKGHVILW